MNVRNLVEGQGWPKNFERLMKDRIEINTVELRPCIPTEDD